MFQSCITVLIGVIFVAVFIMVPGVSAIAVIVNVTLSPLFNVPISHIPVFVSS